MKHNATNIKQTTLLYKKQITKSNKKLYKALDKKQSLSSSCYACLSSNELNSQLNKQITNIFTITSNRNVGKMGFIQSESTFCAHTIQIVYKKETTSDKKFNLITKLQILSPIKVKGILKLNKSKLEIEAQKITQLQKKTINHPIQKNVHSLVYLRSIPHLRTRTKLFKSIFRIQSRINTFAHKYLTEQSFVHIWTPSLVKNRSETGSASFSITTEPNKKNDIALLTVSSQFHLEALAQSLDRVYSINVVFRAEKFNTPRHLIESRMIEIEKRFANLSFCMNFASRFVKQIISDILQEKLEDLETITSINKNTAHIEHLKLIVKSKFSRITYNEALRMLKIKSTHTNQQNHLNTELNWQEEQSILKLNNNIPIFIYNYPATNNRFYFSSFVDPDNKHVLVKNFDLIFSNVGEIAGGGVREKNEHELQKKMIEAQTYSEELKWYLQLRSLSGYSQTAGMGFGLERLTMFICGLTNIQDSTPFPRDNKNNIAF